MRNEASPESVRQAAITSAFFPSSTHSLLLLLTNACARTFGGINFKFQPAKWHQDPHGGTVGEGILDNWTPIRSDPPF
jgi:hypothetical protein